MTKRTFPYQVKRHGCVVTIYESKAKTGYGSYLVRYHRGTEIVRITKANFDEALAEAESAALHLANGELDVLTLRSDDRLSYVRAVEVLKDTGVTLEEAAKQFAQVHRLLQGASLLDTVTAAIKSRTVQVESKTVGQVVAELVQHKRDKGRCEQYVKDLRLRLQKFADAFHCSISSVSTGQIERFLLDRKVSGRTHNNFRRLIGTLFNFATKMGYLPRDHRGVKDVEMATEKPPVIQIFSPGELSVLLTTAKPELVPFIALAAFSGIRHEEIKRLDWEDVKFAQGIIEIPADAAKTKIRRIPPILDNLRSWLLPHVSKGPVVKFANMSKQLLWLAEETGIKWKRNGLRHSFVSYRTAKLQNIPQVSYEAGNSPRIIERNYLKRVTAAEANKWFSIAPVQAANVVCMQTQTHAQTA